MPDTRTSESGTQGTVKLYEWKAVYEDSTGLWYLSQLVPQAFKDQVLGYLRVEVINGKRDLSTITWIKK